MERQRRSRFDSSPFLNTEGGVVICEETPWLIRQFEAMARYPFITAPWLASLSGADAASITSSFKIAKCEPNSYVRIADFQCKDQSARKLHLRSKLVWQPAHRAEALLRQRGIEVQHDEFSGPAEHRLMSCQVRASFDLGVHDDISIIPWTTINADGKVSPHIPTGRVFRDKKGKQRPVCVRADCNPFIINFDDTGASKPPRHYLAGLELDRDTETLAVIKAKYEDQLEVLEHKTYLTHLQFPRLLFPWVTLSQLRMKHMQALWREIAPDKHRNKLLFKVFKDEPTGWALTDPWQTADGELVYLDRP